MGVYVCVYEAPRDFEKPPLNSFVKVLLYRGFAKSPL